MSENKKVIAELQQVKFIIEKEMNEEKFKDRGPITEHVGNALQAVEQQVQKKIKLLYSGKDIFDIYPEIKKELTDRYLDEK